MTRSRWRAQSGVIAAAVILASCTSGRGGPVTYTPTDFGEPDLETVKPASSDPLIVPADKVKVLVYQEPDLSGEYVVDGNGQVDLPLAGKIAVEGYTASEASELIRSRLATTYLRDPKVQLVLSEPATRTITVEGAVGQSGIYPIEGTTTLIRAVAMARGTTRDANDSRVIVFRTRNGQKMAAAFDLQSIRMAQAPDPEIYGNDVIVVVGSRNKEIWREVLSAIPVLGIFTGTL